MKTLRVNYLLVIILTIGISIGSCKKDDDDAGLTNADVALAQDAESQDAVIDQVDQNTDNVLDQIESNEFSSKIKSGTECITVTVDHPDTIYFPKVITLVYNCLDTINGEKITQTGTITITIDTIPVHKKAPWRSHLKRTISFASFTVATDSASFTINGTRTMKRQSSKAKLISDLILRVEVVDSITANLSFTIKYDGVNKTITRNAKKSRQAIMYFRRYVGAGIWRPETKSDTVIIDGTVSGVNAKAEEYSRTTTTPLKFTFCPIWPFNPIISSGTIEFKVGTMDPYTITYSAEGCRTIATLTRNGKTKTIERRLANKFRIGW